MHGLVTRESTEDRIVVSVLWVSEDTKVVTNSSKIGILIVLIDARSKRCVNFV